MSSEPFNPTAGRAGPRLTGMIPGLTPDRRSVFFQLMHQLASATSESDAARHIAKATDALCPWDAFSLNSYDAATDSVGPLLTIDLVAGTRQEVSAGDLSSNPSAIAREVIHSGARLILRDDPAESDFATAPFGDKARRSASLMFAPVRSGANVVGILSVQSYRPGAYRQDDLETLQAVADLIAGAMGRMRAERALQQREEHLRFMADNTDDIMTVVSTTGERLYVSPSNYRITGWTAADLADTDWRTRVHPEDVPAAEQAWLALLSGQPATIELRARCRDGSYLWIEQRSKPLADETGQVRQILNSSRDITARKQAEAALRESEARLKALYEFAPLGVFVTMPNGDCNYTNPAYQRIAGLSFARTLGTGWRDAIHPEDRDRVFREWYEAVCTKPFSSVSFHRFLRPDGSVVLTEVHAAEMCEGERVIGYVGTVQDITERTQAEAALAEKENRYRRLFELSPSGICLERADGTIIEVNEALCRDSGYTRDELVGANVSLFVPPESALQMQSNLAHLAAGHTLVQEVVNVRKDGAHRRVALRETPIPLADGTTGILVLAEDVTDQRRAEATVRLHANVMEQMADALLLCDLDGVIRDCNPAAEKMFGYPRAELIGQTPAMLHMPSEASMLTQSIIETVRAHGVARHEITFIRKDGTQGLCETVTAALTGPDDRMAAVFGVNRDITERRRLQREILEISDREQARIGQDLHDGICQQLIGIAYGVNHLARTLDQDGATGAAEAGKISDVLDEAITETRRIARGLYPPALHMESFAVALRELASQAGRRYQLPVDLDLDEDVRVATPETAAHLFRIAQEAINNAGQHAGARRLTVRLHAQAGGLVLEVADDGAGMPAALPQPGGMGLRIMRHRAAVIGADFLITQPTGLATGGTLIRCSLPLESTA